MTQEKPWTQRSRSREALQADHPDEEIGIAFGHFDMVEGEPRVFDELRDIKKRYNHCQNAITVANRGSGERVFRNLRRS